MNRRDFLGVIGAQAAFWGTSSLISAQDISSWSESGQDKPNVLLLLVDDLGWGDVTCYNNNSAIKTPNIDELSQQGIRFTSAHSPSSVCTPTRYGLLTGRYAWRTSMKEGVISDIAPALIDPDRMTLGSLMKEAGYYTSCIGKWHLGVNWHPKPGDPGDWQWGQDIRYSYKSIRERIDHSKPFENGPTALGFDYFFGSLDQRTGNYIEGNVFTDIPVKPDADDIFVDKAIDTIRKHISIKPSQPFFQYLALTAPHVPLTPPADLKGKSGDGRRGDMCLWADRSLGRMSKALKQMDLEKNTLVIFASDNGPALNTRWPDGNPDHDPSGPFRGYKTDIWDGGTRVPFIVKWPGKIKPGTLLEKPLCLVDTMATLAALVKIPLPEWAGEDSFNALPALLGDESFQIRDHLITHSYTGVFSIRKGDWKLILYTKGSGGHQGITPGWQPLHKGWDHLGKVEVGQLYNIRLDPYEQNDLWENHPKVIGELRSLLLDYRGSGKTRD